MSTTEKPPHEGTQVMYDLTDVEFPLTHILVNGLRVKYDDDAYMAYNRTYHELNREVGWEVAGYYNFLNWVV